MTCVSEPFVPENLAGQIKYLIDNQDVWLVKAIARVSDTELVMGLDTGERYRLTIERVD